MRTGKGVAGSYRKFKEAVAGGQGVGIEGQKTRVRGRYQGDHITFEVDETTLDENTARALREGHTDFLRWLWE